MVLDALTVEARAGEILVIEGNRGAGKTKKSAEQEAKAKETLSVALRRAGFSYKRAHYLLKKSATNRSSP